MEKKDLNLSGAGKMTGGEYRNVKVSGAGKITSDVVCETMTISGAVNVDGSVKADCCKVSGACQIRGDVKAKELKISGGSSVGGNLEGEKISMSGGIKVGGDLKANELRLSGDIRVGSVECEELKMSGAMRAKGTVNCERCELELAGKSEMEELVGSTIRVTADLNNARGILGNLLGFDRGSLKVEVVEGDDIFLENTTCAMVRGAQVRIGAGCRIGSVEYTDRLDVHKDAQVEHQVQI